MTTHDDFYRRLRRRLQRWAQSEAGRHHRWTEYLLLAPDLFHLLVTLMLDDEVPAREKARLGLAVAYFVSPLDLLPELVLGPAGLADDIVLAAYVLNGVINHTPRHVVARHWAGEGDVLEVVARLLQVADTMLGAGLAQKLRRRFGQRP